MRDSSWVELHQLGRDIGVVVVAVLVLPLEVVEVLVRDAGLVELGLPFHIELVALLLVVVVMFDVVVHVVEDHEVPCPDRFWMF